MAKSAPRKKFHLALYDDLTHDHIWKIHFTKIGITITLAAVLILLVALTYVVIAYTPIRTLIPGYPDEKARRVAVTYAVKIDSLEYEIRKYDLYAENLRRVLEGEQTLSLDSLFTHISAAAARPSDPESVEWLRLQEASLRVDVLEAEQAAEDQARIRAAGMEGLDFFVPVQGVVTTGFDPSSHPYADITVPSGSTVMAVLDGTIVLSDWHDQYGYSIVIQHDGDLVSVYRRCATLTRQAGEKVKAGTPIALTGPASGADASSEDHLLFELWYRGVPVDPAGYIRF